MKKLLILIGIVLIIVLTATIIYNFKYKKMNKEAAISLINKGENYENIKIRTKIKDELGHITNIEFIKKDNIELYNEKNESGERIEWTDTNKKETLIIDEDMKTYEWCENYEREKTNYNDSNYKYKFIRTEKYENVKCAVLKFTEENLSEQVIWVDLQTGLILKKKVKIYYDNESTYEYEEYMENLLDCVTEKDVLKPDITEYSSQIDFSQIKQYR